MDPITALRGEESLPDRFMQLWETSPSLPCVFDFLRAQPPTPLVEWLDVLIVDQKLRWRRGQALPLRTYLIRCPEIAVRGDFVRALVQSERLARRDWMARLNQVQGIGPGHADPSATTQRFFASQLPLGTELDLLTSTASISRAGSASLAETGLKSTKDYERSAERNGAASFSLDEDHRMLSEA